MIDMKKLRKLGMKTGYEEVMEKHVLWTMNGNYDRLAGM